MLIAALRDLQWRHRRFLIAVIGTGVLFAMTLALTGLANGFQVEAQRTVSALGIETYLIPTGAADPFLSSTPFPEVELGAVAATSGRSVAVPLVYAETTLRDGGATRITSIFGAPEGGPGMPAIISGRAPSGRDEVAVSNTLGRKVGDDLEIGSGTVRIVGLVDDSTALGGQPNIFLTVAGAQQVAYAGKPLISSIGIRGTLADVPDGYRAVGQAAAVDDLMLPVRSPASAITLMAVLLWVVEIGRAHV